jgi:hypothetical protein
MIGALVGTSIADHFMKSKIRRVATLQRELNMRWKVIQAAEARNQLHYRVCRVPWQLNGLPLIVEGEVVE